MFPLAHLRALWGRWWLAPFAPLPLLPILAWTGNLRIEHIVIVAVLVVLGVATARTRALLIACVPGVAVGLGYEIIRFLRPVFITPDKVLGCDLAAFEARFFGLPDGRTLPDFFVAHHTRFWDFFFAVPYTIFWMAAVAYGIVLFFTNRPRMRRFLWVLAATHAVAFAIWLIWPAAPPWYIREYGCAIDMNALPDAAALSRLDDYLGISYFRDYYSRTPNVFGALPSLHCAFPTAALVSAWPDSGWRERALHVFLILWMLSASVYLDHHWLVDGLAGIAIVIAVHAVIHAIPEALRRRRAMGA
ncbi:MAG: phosphatase PAP2 family protein [Flavobacteriaceae bacterium]